MDKIKILVIIILFAGISCTQRSAKEKQLIQERKDLYLEQGQIISSLSFGTLSKTLRNAYDAGGVKGAVKYCKLKAHPLIDSLSFAYDAKIKRTSLQLRNKENTPTAAEKEMLLFYTSKIESDEEIIHEVKVNEDGTYTYFAPIKIISPLCLNCHGKLVETLFEENYKVINELYPDDKAIGYELNDLRGVWSISFDPSIN